MVTKYITQVKHILSIRPRRLCKYITVTRFTRLLINRNFHQSLNICVDWLPSPSYQAMKLVYILTCTESKEQEKARETKVGRHMNIDETFVPH